ncbi:AP2-like ethylene-responsive transcription factor ANT [Ananas comosus]|uniref:AP2-like ethylene-responsive transcription factor ANT n=1 Tax=Ananas comosus TaxID=4615 RepID=A0A199UUD0_ANACO|nr:AP2-like ethylene-responsive transcription factor ANT [Ananas comosus]
MIEPSRRSPDRSPPPPPPPRDRSGGGGAADEGDEAEIGGGGGGAEIAAIDRDEAIDDGEAPPTSSGDAAAAEAEAEAGKGEEKKVGSLLAAAMKKYAVPRSSSYHGSRVCRLKWSGKYEAHLWDSTSQVEGRKRKGKHGIRLRERARGNEDHVSEEFVAYVRRTSSCFSRGASVYRGVTRRKDGKWQARIGRVGSRDAKISTLELSILKKKQPKLTTLRHRTARCQCRNELDSSNTVTEV